MIKFKPIAYNDGDFRAFRMSSAASDATEGAFCVLAASTTRNKMVATLFSGIATIALNDGGAATVALADSGDVFVVWRENVDIENISATIEADDEIIGMPLVRGNEFEVHNTALYNSALTLFTAVGQNVFLNTNGKMCHATATNATKLLVGECVGTFNSVWLRVRIK